MMLNELLPVEISGKIVQIFDDQSSRKIKILLNGPCLELIVDQDKELHLEDEVKLRGQFVIVDQKLGLLHPPAKIPPHKN